MDKHNFMYSVLNLFNISNVSIIDLKNSVDVFASQNNTDLTTINNDLNTFRVQNNTDLTTIIERLPVSGYTNGYTFEAVPVTSNIEVFIGAIANRTTGTSFIQKCTISMLEDLKPDRYRIYKGTLSNLSSPTYTSLNDTFIEYVLSPTVINNSTLKLVYDETIAHDVSAIKVDFTDIQLKLEQNEILLISALNIGNGNVQTCYGFVSWYDR